MSADEKRIREFAYQIWESEGRPNGNDQRHWEMARKLAEAEALAPDKTAARSASKPRLPKIDGALDAKADAKPAGKASGKAAPASKPAAKPAPKAGKPATAKPAAKPAPKPAPAATTATPQSEPASKPAAVKKPRKPAAS
ncbi:DUF2934 domain-containing protein [Pseudomonas sp. LJDD11]|uniref:DUF2934 domain-containing protein n=1 Tax=Pseudomonas sp. LJDD11 TaxID=2931984 RepID=UPI00211C8984|nr:DUF2934 domain-containing protein [Pseudomonas sp. LJDD11]MCQ9423083.1 DUF2934 domain-containing protein [Pseudomonas sp. LJDD11]